MTFLETFAQAQSGIKLPPVYVKVTGLFLVQLAIERRVRLDYGYFKVSPTIYHCLVGDPGCGKSTAKDLAADIWREACPDYPELPSITSAGDIIRCMSKNVRPLPGSATSYYSPVIGWVNELEDFMRYEPSDMVDFLTGVFDVPVYSAGTLARGKEIIPNPLFQFIACTTEDYVTTLLLNRTVKGGLLRRLIFWVNKTSDDYELFPEQTPAALAARARCVDWLRELVKIEGTMLMTPDAKQFYIDWYGARRKTINTQSVWVGYHVNINNIMLRLAISFAMAEPKPQLVMERRHMEEAVTLLESNEPRLVEIEAYAGRNPLLGVQRKLMGLLKARGGCMPEKVFHRMASIDMGEFDYKNMVNLLKSTDQVVVAPVQINGSFTEMVYLPDKWKDVEAKLRGATS